MKQTTNTCNSTETIADLYEECYEQLKAYFNSYCRDETSAEDMVQTLFLKILSVDSVNTDTLRSLVFSTAHNMIIDNARHREHIYKAKKYFMQFSETQTTPSIYDQLEMEKMLEIEAQYVGSMPKKRARIYRLWRDDTMTAKKIADDMNISVRTVEHHIYLATKGMKDFFQKAM